MARFLRSMMILCGIFALVGFKVAPGLTSLAIAQNEQLRQFQFTIKQRKLQQSANLIRVTQGDAVEIALTGDEAAELHLHGYDLKLHLEPNVPSILRFTAKTAGRFPLEVHRFGIASTSGRHRSVGPLFYLEVQPR